MLCSQLCGTHPAVWWAAQTKPAATTVSFRLTLEWLSATLFCLFIRFVPFVFFPKCFAVHKSDRLCTSYLTFFSLKNVSQKYTNKLFTEQLADDFYLGYFFLCSFFLPIKICDQKMVTT